MSAEKMRNVALRYVAGLALVMAIVLLPNRRTEDWNTLAKVGLVALVVVLVVVVAALLPVRYTVDHRGLTIRRLAGFTRTIEWARLGHGVYVDDFRTPAQAGAQSMSRVFLRDPAGAKVLALNSQTSGRDELHRLVAALGQQRFELVPGPINGKDLGARYPSLVSVVERRPVLIGAIAGIVIVAAIVVGVLLFADY